MHVLKPSGEVQIALKSGEPYDSWEVPQLLTQQGYQLILKQALDKSQYPGYVHRLTNGMAGTLKRVRDEGAMVYVYGKRGATDGECPTTSIPPSSLHLDEGIKITIVALLPALECESVGESAAAAMPVVNRPTDDLMDERIFEILGGNKRMTVLEIRRRFDHQYENNGPGLMGQSQKEEKGLTEMILLPDTRLLNRRLYALEAKGSIVRGPPGRVSKKPTWRIRL